MCNCGVKELMKIYLDNCIIDEWLKFQSRRRFLADYVKNTAKKAMIARDLEAFGEIIDKSSAIFFYSLLDELESSKHRKWIFDDLVSQNNFVRVPTTGLRICMLDEKLPEDAALEIGECQSYFAEHIRKFGLKNIKDKNELMKYMRKKFFDPMHIDSAINARADIFLTIDYKLLRSIDADQNIKTFLAHKIRALAPSEFIKQAATTHNTG
jgi:predicted nucleic acid-binding protein